MVAMMDGSQPKAMVAALDATAHPVLPVAPKTTSAVGRMDGVMAKGPSDTTVVAEETGRELSLVLTLGGLHPPMQDEFPLRWSLIACSREKSRFLHEHKEDWDRLRVAELTPLATEADNLRRREAEACRDAEDAEKSLDELSERAWWDQEDGARVWKEQDELLQWDAEIHQRIIDLLAKAEKEWDLRLGAEERSVTLEQRAKLDAEVVAQLRKERDELRHTTERLCSEHGAAYGECNQAIQERAKA
ncbi:uncharacterized protein [Miscanthus floridulus]|uniref:uncharacterized protein n=1 Tax=Miscanthus floridulus TaxID=154761 RepID=UPI00345A6920